MCRSKSTKLLAAFNLLDEDSDGFLTRRGTWRFFRSFLSSLVAMSSTFEGCLRPELNRLLDDVSVQVTSEVLGGSTSKVSFDLISDWYAGSGYMNSTWVELLDLNKWGGVEGVSEEFASEEEDHFEESEDSDDEESTEGGDSLDMEKEGVLVMRTASDHAMSITVEDTNRVFALSIASGLRLLDASQLEQIILRFAGGDGRIGPAGFLNFLQSVMPQSTAVSSSQRDNVIQHLFSIYYAFEQSAASLGENSGKVDVFGLAAGLSVLCLGSKSSKLGVGFGLFSDGEGAQEGSLSQAAVAGLMASYLLTLQALDVLPEGSLAIEVAMHVSRIMAESIEGSVNFISFGKWYNVEGCHCAPWIELLNLEKWLKITGTDGVPPEYLEDPLSSPHPYQKLLGDEEDGNDGDDSDDDNDDDAIINSRVARGGAVTSRSMRQNDEEETFSIIFNSASYERRINVDRRTATSVDDYTRSLLGGIDEFGTMCSAIDAESESSLIRREKFQRILEALSIPVDLSLHTQARGTSFIMTVFEYFDRGNTQEVDVSDLIIALACLLHKGSKSEKLAFAFDLLDVNGEGKLGKWNAWRFFRCFITTIVLMAAPQVEGKKEFVQILADESASWVTDSVFKHVEENGNAGGETDDDDGAIMITFDDIADWYSTSGCEDSSWIELLNISKWLALVNPPKQMSG